ncbi:MAG: sugar phosphate isomerase/epimerase [Rectinemataceae bacterium]|nr:sugar phosphate isomerase/epimerase [Rectinemataceae bacterium]
MFGVSPAYFFSRYTTDFTVAQYAEGLDQLKSMGFGGFQLEVFKAERIGEWLDGADALAARAAALGMTVSQFVAHFLLYATKDEVALLSDCGYEDMKHVVEIVSRFPGCGVVTLPLSPFAFPAGASFSLDDWKRLWEGLCAKLLRMAGIVESAGLKLALEIVPGCLLGGTEGLLRFSRETGNASIGYNFDTGHAWSSKENIATLPAKLAGRIYGTHLKDNFGFENLALPPGEGNIPWESVVDGLLRNGYTGSFDLEIACARPEDVEAAYAKGKTRIQSALSASIYR